MSGSVIHLDKAFEMADPFVAAITSKLPQPFPLWSTTLYVFTLLFSYHRIGCTARWSAGVAPRLNDLVYEPFPLGFVGTHPPVAVQRALANRIDG